MEDVSSLLSRIDQEFSASNEKLKAFKKEQSETYRGKQDRLEQFAKDCEKLKQVWRPRLEALAKKFGENAKVTPRVEPSLREALFEFRSNLASIRLRFTASTDNEVQNLVLDYDLHIIPILMKFEPHARIEFPLGSADPQAAAKWIDDRIVDFVRTYLSLHENEYYLKPQLVTDPIAGIEFPKSAAGATLELGGKTYYFIGEDTRAEFEKKQAAAKVATDAAAKAAAAKLEAAEATAKAKAKTETKPEAKAEDGGAAKEGTAKNAPPGAQESHQKSAEKKVEKGAPQKQK